MIHFTKITATDTFSYRKQIFTFEDGLHSISGVNGSSKTSLFLAIQQALFNKNSKGCKVEDVSNSITGNPYEVELEFTKGSDEYRIVNSRKTGKIDLYKNGKNIALRKIPEVLKQIQEVLGCDYELFADLTYQSKESKLNLLDSSTNKGRAEFVNRILKLNELDSEFARLNGRRKELEGKNGLISQLQNSIEMLKATISEEVLVPDALPEGESNIPEMRLELERLIKEQAAVAMEYNTLSEALKQYDLQEDKRNKIETLKSQIKNIDPRNEEEVEKELNNIADSIVQRKETISKAEGQLAQQLKDKGFKETRQQLKVKLQEIDPPDKPLEECLDQKAKIEKAYTVKTEQIRSKEAECKKLEKASKLGVCPTCTSVVDPAQFDGAIATLQEEIEELSAFCEKCKTGLIKYNNRISVWNQINKINTEIEKIPEGCYSPTKVSALEAELHVEGLQLEELYESQKELRNWIQVQAQNRSKLDMIRQLEQEFKVIVEPDKNKLEALGTKLVHYTAQIKAARIDIEKVELQQAQVLKHNAERRTKIAVNKQIEESNQQVYLSIAQKQKELAEAQEKLDLLKLWVNILGPKGYRTQMVSKFLNALNTTMYHYSNLMCDGRINCMFKLSEIGEIVFEITDEAKVQDLALWSGGETARIKIVCLFAVLEMLEVMGSTSFNVICLDEIFSALDQEGKEGLFKVLEHLKQKRKAIYVIAHEELTLDLMYDSVIKAEKLSDGTTRLVQ